MPSSKRSVRFADASPAQPKNDSKAAEESLKKRFVTPIALSDPTASAPAVSALHATSKVQNSALHEALADRLRARSAAVHKSVLMSMTKGAWDAAQESLTFVEARKKAPEGEVQPENKVEDTPAVAQPEEQKKILPPPLVEWWDEKWYNPMPDGVEITRDTVTSILKNAYTECAYTTVFKRPDTEAAGLSEKAVGLDIKLPEERKKDRKRNRAERAQEVRQKIHAGEAKPNAPKLTMENIHGILKNRKMPAMDPIECETLVVADEVTRRQNHEARNQSNKKTPEERSAKKRAQLQREADTGLQVHFYKIRALRGPKDVHRNLSYQKIIMNVQQLFVSGMLAVIAGEHHVLMECGRKPSQKMRALLERRMGDVIECSLEYAGDIAKRHFSDFDVKEFGSMAMAKAYLSDLQYGFLIG